MKIADDILDDLKKAARPEGIRRIRHETPGADPWPIPWQRWRAFVRNGWCEERVMRDRKGRTVDFLVITDKGREALDPPARPRKDSMDSMRAKGPATTRVMQGNVWIEQRMPEPEKVPAHELSASWRDEARERHEGAETPRQLAARLVSELRSREQRRAA